MSSIKGLCHGCFDLIHYGHILHFREARSQCDHLIVSITSDRFAAKSPGRPIYPESHRLAIINELSCVDNVIITDYPTAVEIIAEVKPTYYFKGIDYSSSSDPRLNAEIIACESVGCSVRYTSSLKYSTTDFISLCQAVKLD